MPPVSLPLNDGTYSERAGAHANMPNTATKPAARIIRIANSIKAVGTLKRIFGHEKNERALEVELSEGVAPLHLTGLRLRGTVRALLFTGGLPHARPACLTEKVRPERRAWHSPGPACLCPGGPGGQPARIELLAFRSPLRRPGRRMRTGAGDHHQPVRG